MFLDKKILELDHSVSYGSVALKSLQNDNIPELDLLVREAIQNSSDASLKEPGDSFSVQFNTGVFNPAVFNTNLTGVEKILDSMYSGDTAEYLEIRDTKTEGLTGCIRKKDINPDDHGNFFKLIYDTGKKQTQKNAGGNWGFGKSVYYRVGMGIVIFYSRIKVDSGYESRLIITLVEDENSPTAILGKVCPNSAGKAWWGIKDNEDFLPLTDEIFIRGILDIFGVKSFGATETGTSIIIPYIKTDELIKNIIPEEASISDDIRSRCTWAYNFEEYLTLAIQKWYAPKIQNRHLKEFCNKKWLGVWVNNKPLRYDSMLPFFKLVQELYTTAIAKTFGSEYQSEWLTDITCYPVHIRDYFDSQIDNSISGYVAAIRINKDDLYGGQNYMDPCIYTRHFEEDPDINEPMLMYARDPGMVIEYTIAGPWVRNIAAPESSDEYIFAFYMPITEKKLKDDLSEKKFAGMELGEYLRECEASDHMGWNDPANMQVVVRIQRNTVKQLQKNLVSEKSDGIEATASKLSGRLGRKLLPRVGYGRKKGGSGGTSGGTGGSKINNTIFKVLSQKYLNNELAVEFELKLTQGKRTAEFTNLSKSEAGLIDPKSWENEIGTEFPIRISDISVCSISSGDENYAFDTLHCNSSDKSVSNEFVEISIIDDGKVYTSFKLISKVPVPTIKGTILLKATDKKYRPDFKIV